MASESDDWWISTESALAVGERLIKSPEELDLVCEHIVKLLSDASRLISQGSHATAAFLAITAIEETSKAHIGIYRRSNVKIKRTKDPLYKHGEKHKLAASPTVKMGSRLQAAIGRNRMDELIELARNGGFVQIREAALYVEQKGNNLITPSQAVAAPIAREILLLAIEIFDDALVGYTSKSMEMCRVTDSIFEELVKINY